VLALHRVGGEFWNTDALGAAVAFGHYDDRHPARPHQLRRAALASTAREKPASAPRMSDRPMSDLTI